MFDTPTEQEIDLSNLQALHSKLEKVALGTKLTVVVNKVSDQSELFCVEKKNNPPELRFAWHYYGVATGKELTAIKTLNKWEFRT